MPFASIKCSRTSTSRSTTPDPNLTITGSSPRIRRPPAPSVASRPLFRPSSGHLRGIPFRRPLHSKRVLTEIQGLPFARTSLKEEREYKGRTMPKYDHIEKKQKQGGGRGFVTAKPQVESIWLLPFHPIH